MSEGSKTPYEVLAIQKGMLARAVSGHADRDHQTLRAACAMIDDRVNVALFLGDMLRAECERHKGRPHGPDTPVGAVADEIKLTCSYKEPANWRVWCWTCRARGIVSGAKSPRAL